MEKHNVSLDIAADYKDMGKQDEAFMCPSGGWQVIQNVTLHIITQNKSQIYYSFMLFSSSASCAVVLCSMFFRTTQFTITLFSFYSSRLYCKSSVFRAVFITEMMYDSSKAPAYFKLFVLDQQLLWFVKYAADMFSTSTNNRRWKLILQVFISKWAPLQPWKHGSYHIFTHHLGLNKQLIVCKLCLSFYFRLQQEKHQWTDSSQVA